MKYERIIREAFAKKSLKGISIGDAFGESFFGERNEILQHIQQRTIPKTSWEFTDDTVRAIAVAVATAIATKAKIDNKTISPIDFIESIVKELPDTDTSSKIKKSISVPYSYRIETVKTILGNGTNIMAQDTVPFSIWCAAYNLNNFKEAIWKAVSILGDRDTICAIVGGITMMSTLEENIPIAWMQAVEDFEKSVFRN